MTTLDDCDKTNIHLPRISQLSLSILLLLVSFPNADAQLVKLYRPKKTAPQSHFIQDVDLSYDVTEHNSEQNSLADEERVVRTQWDRHRRWSLVASQRKSGIMFYRSTALTLMAAGAALQTLGQQLPPPPKCVWGWAVSLMGGACIGAAPLVTANFLSQEKMLSWVNSRAASESIKSEVYKFRAGAKPYNSDDSIEVLIQRGKEISKSLTDPLYPIVRSDGTPPPPRLDREGYMENRLQRQINGFYRKNARELAKKSKVFKVCQTVLLGGSSLVGFVSGAKAALDNINVKLVGPWGAVMATMAGTVGSYIASCKLDEQALEYSAAAEMLVDLEETWPLSVTPESEDWDKYVLDCEEIIAATTKKWANTNVGAAKGEGRKQSKQKENDPATWNPDVVCGDETHGFYRASDRAMWLIENKDMSEGDARKKVMKEYPKMFLYDFDDE